MKKMIYRGHELDERIWFRIKNDQDFKRMFDDCLDDLYQPDSSKREDSINGLKLVKGNSSSEFHLVPEAFKEFPFY